jgi:hypothetical protein
MLQVSLFEGSNDGVTWLPYRFRYLPTSRKEPPGFFAPHHPRFDAAAVYATTCVFDASFFGALAGDGTAYATYARSSWLERMCQRLLEGDPMFIRMFRSNPFPAAPPKLMRVSCVALTPARLEVQRATGEYWHERRCGTFVQPLARAEWPEAIALPEPEVFHPDWVDYKRSSAPIKAMTQAFASGMAPEQAILSASDLSADEVARFWDELVPRLNERRGDYEHYLSEASAIMERFGMPALARYERILERFAWLLRVRTERHWYADAQPKLPIDSNFRYHMFLHELVMDGREAYLAYLDDPARVVARLEQSSDERQLWSLAILRHRLMLSHIATFRWTLAGSDMFKRKLHGLFEYYPVLAPIVPPGEDWCPVITKHADGEHTISDFYPPPGLSALRDQTGREAPP